MAEYERKQRTQLSRAVANSETGSRKLRGVVDNRHIQNIPINTLNRNILQFALSPEIIKLLKCQYNILKDEVDTTLGITLWKVSRYFLERCGIKNPSYFDVLFVKDFLSKPVTIYTREPFHATDVIFTRSATTHLVLVDGTSGAEKRQRNQNLKLYQKLRTYGFFSSNESMPITVAVLDKYKTNMLNIIRTKDWVKLLSGDYLGSYNCMLGQNIIIGGSFFDDSLTFKIFHIGVSGSAQTYCTSHST